MPSLLTVFCHYPLISTLKINIQRLKKKKMSDEEFKCLLDEEETVYDFEKFVKLEILDKKIDEPMIFLKIWILSHLYSSNLMSRIIRLDRNSKSYQKSLLWI